MNKKNLWVLALSLPIALWSCNDSTVVPKVDTPTARTLSTTEFKEFVARLAPVADTLQLSSNGGTVTTNKGTTIRFANNSFRLNGQPYQGNITVIVRENFSKGESILNGMPTQTATSMLTSAGSLYVRAFGNGQQLTLGGQITMNIPPASISGFDPTMRVYAGDTTGGTFAWQEVSPNVGFINTRITDSVFSVILNERTPPWEWINLDKPIEDGTPTTISLSINNLPTTVNNGTMAAFLVLEDRFSVATFMFSDMNTLRRTNAPAGLRARIIAYAKDSETTWFGKTDVFTIQENGQYSLQMDTVESEEQLKELINNL